MSAGLVVEGLVLLVAIIGLQIDALKHKICRDNYFVKSVYSYNLLIYKFYILENDSRMERPETT